MRERCAREVTRQPLTPGGRIAFACIGATVVLLTLMSALDRPLGLPTCLAGLASVLGVAALTRRSPLPCMRSIAWSVLPLVAGLFVIVEALDRTGVIEKVAAGLQIAAAQPMQGAAIAGSVLAFGCNLMNNLPAGLVATMAVARSHPPRLVVDALLIGVDLGPNLSITGSLATVLWLQAIRREGADVGFWQFFTVGVRTMVPALAAALAVRLLLG